MQRFHLFSVNDPYSRPTFEATHIEDWPDVTLASFSVCPWIKTWSIDEDLNYGHHRLITVELNTQFSKLPKRRYRTKDVFFRRFIQNLQESLERSNLYFKNIEAIFTFDRRYRDFLGIVIESCEKNFKKSPSTHVPRIQWWSNILKIKRNFVKALYRKSKLSSSTEEDKLHYKRERALYKKAILEAKRSAWQDFCKKTRDPYGKTKKVAFQNFYRTELYALSESTTETQSRADFYTDLTTRIFGISEETQEPEINSVNSAPYFTEKELQVAIFSFNQDKAPGIDNIGHRIITKIFKANPTLLLDMYNSLLQLNYFPKDWRVGELVYFLKHGKPP